MAEETVVVTTSETPPEGETVLGEAAVASAAAAGAAIVEAQHASDDAANAEAAAANANMTAGAALDAALNKPDRAEVEALVDTKVNSAKDEIIAAIKETQAAPPPVVTEPAKPADPLPKSVDDPEKKTFSERFLGL